MIEKRVLSPEELLRMKAKGLHFNWVPAVTKKEFKKWANDNFSAEGSDEYGNYGAAFAHIWEVFKGTMPIANEDIELMMGDHEARLQKLESKKDVDRTIQLASGKRIEVKRRS